MSDEYTPPDEELVQEAISSFGQASKPDAPTINKPRSNVISLMYGVELDGEQRTTVEVRELTGRDEEALSKLDPASPSYVVLLVDTVIRNGVLTLGGVKPQPDSLRNLLMGDRDLIFKEILLATYGTEKEYKNIMCPHCKEQLDFDVNVEQMINVQQLDGEPTFTVVLRDGREVLMHFPTGKDQLNVYSMDKQLTDPEINTLMLKRCIDEVDGQPLANPHKFALDLGIKDRALMVEALAKGPSVTFKEVEVPCDHCGNDIPVVLTWADLLQL